MQALPFKGFAQVVESVASWQQAIQLSAKPLVDEGFADISYRDALIENVFDECGRGFVAPYAIFPAGTHVKGVFHEASSVLLVRRPFYFEGAQMPIRLLVLIASTSAHGHLTMLRCTSRVLNDAARVRRIMDCTESEGLEEAFFGGEA